MQEVIIPLPATPQESTARTNQIDTHPVTTAKINDSTSGVAALPAQTSYKENFKLILEVEEVDSKYLNKDVVAEATTETQKASGLKKLLHKAYHLKDNQDAFAELRDMKNELLALDLLKKQKEQRTQ